MKYGKIYEGDLIIKEGDKNDYSQLEKVTGSLSIYSNTELSAPNAKFNVKGTRELF